LVGARLIGEHEAESTGTACMAPLPRCSGTDCRRIALNSIDAGGG
jgi:hypothetical protein